MFGLHSEQELTSREPVPASNQQSASDSSRTPFHPNILERSRSDTSQDSRQQLPLEPSDAGRGAEQPVKSSMSSGIASSSAMAGGVLLPPFGTRHLSHLPTPQSPQNPLDYLHGSPLSPGSPLTYANYRGAPHGSMSTLTPIARRVYDPTTSKALQGFRPIAPALPNPMQQVATPESSPVTNKRTPPVPEASILPSIMNASSLTTPRHHHESSVKSESPTPGLAPAPFISPPISSHSSDAVTSSGLSSPFMAKTIIADRSSSPINSSRSIPPEFSSHDRPTVVDDVFSVSGPPSVTVLQSPAPLASPIPERAAGGEMERIRLQMQDIEVARQYENEIRRPDYLRRVKRSQLDLEPPVIEEDDLDERERFLPGLGIAVSPQKGRRLKLFQETSEESFEQSLTIDGYRSYGSCPAYDEPMSGRRTPPAAPLTQHTVDWLAQTTPRQPGPPQPPPIEIIDAKEMRKRKRLAAFQESTLASTSSRLYPVEMDGKGRFLSHLPAEQLSEILEAGGTPKKKRVVPRSKKVLAAVSLSAKKGKLVRGDVPDFDVGGPNWLDTEFPWSLREQERAEQTKAEEAERLKCIEKFLERDTDDEDDDEEEVLPSAAWGQIYEDPPLPSRWGRGKVVPLNADPDSRQNDKQRHSMVFPSDPADARAALLSKKAVRALAFKKHSRRFGDDGESSDDEVVCVCQGRDDGRELVQCDDCQTWYHLVCIGINDISELGAEDDPWYCADCADAHSPQPVTPELLPAPASEPTFVPTDDEPATRKRQDPLFYQSSMQESPTAPWSSSRPPQTPTRHADLMADPSSSYSSSDDPRKPGPSTPYSSAHGVRVYSTPGMFEGYQTDESPFDPTSTPSRGIRFDAPFVTPKSNWSARAGGLFQTPVRPNPTYASPRPGSYAGPPFTPMDESSDLASSPIPARSTFQYDDTPVRHAKPGNGHLLPRRIFDSPLGQRSNTTAILQVHEPADTRHAGMSVEDNAMSSD